MESLPFYRRIYNFLLEEITSGRLKNGDLLPSEKELCATFNVSRITSKRALELLAEQGYISRFPGKGSFVSSVVKTVDGRGMDKTLALLMPDYSDSFGVNLLNGVVDGCCALGYHVILKRTRDQIRIEENSIRSLVEAGVAGFLILPVHGTFYNPEILKLTLNNKPVVFVDRKIQGLKVSSVSTDNQSGAALGVEYLFRLGHRKIGFYSGMVKDTSSIEERRDGFLQAFVDFEIKYETDYFCHSLQSAWTFPFYNKDQVDADIRHVAEHIRLHPELTAAFVAEYRMAQVVKKAAKLTGRNVPNNFSILCFDSPPSLFGLPPYTHILQDEYAIGNRAVELLHSLITGKETVLPKQILIQTKLVVGSSTAPL
ncbi:MAG: GntR family transcriptional regulator [Treponema sp.]|jgi:DNA-binding LacI/PurR family transcriptional regulator|nr:GntR family transcriptional regulator [Treponema sp.]